MKKKLFKIHSFLRLVGELHTKSFKKKTGCFILLLFSLSFKIAIAQTSVVAIDILLEPDHIMLDSAKAYNSLMRKDYSGAGSYALDAAHQPHISVLQCFVKKTDLEKVYSSVAKVVKREQPTDEKLKSKGFYYIPFKGLGLAGITIHPTIKLLNFQSSLISALKPFIVAGTDAAFIQNAGGKPIAQGTSEYVNAFIPEHSGANYNPHVTIGLANEVFLKKLLAKPYHEFSFKNISVSIFQLGDFGTAQKKLWTSTKK